MVNESPQAKGCRFGGLEVQPMEPEMVRPKWARVEGHQQHTLQQAIEPLSKIQFLHP